MAPWGVQRFGEVFDQGVKEAFAGLGSRPFQDGSQRGIFVQIQQGHPVRIYHADYTPKRSHSITGIDLLQPVSVQSTHASTLQRESRESLDIHRARLRSLEVPINQGHDAP